MNRPFVLVVGDVMTDVLVRAGVPFAPGSDTPSVTEDRAGGSAANKAVWLGSSGAAEVHFVGRVGRDAFASFHTDAFRQAGVQAHLAEDPERPTGTVVVIVDAQTGERSMFNSRGANIALGIPDVPDGLLRPGGHLQLSGYQFFTEPTRPLALGLLERARAHGMSVSVDPSAESLLRAVGVDRFLAWTEGVDLLVPNLDEGRVLTGERTPEAVAGALADRYGEVALKLGPEGAIWARRGGSIVRVPADPALVVDTTGAGDAFCAGFLSVWLTGGPPEAALREGCRLGAAATTVVGARPQA